MHFSSNYSAIANFAPGIMSMEVLIGIDATVCQNCFEEKSALRAQKGQVHIAGSIGFKTYMEVFIQNNPHTKKVDGSHKRFITLSYNNLQQMSLAFFRPDFASIDGQVKPIFSTWHFQELTDKVKARNIPPVSNLL